MTSELQEYIGQPLVVDSKSYYTYIGTLVAEGEIFITLKDVDVHDQRDSNTSKELYLIESLKYGIKVNRSAVKIVRSEIISLSLLSDIVKY
jgi:small nuclear ribonucleoprotein (snRNP)-like protein